jgi:hypothetical protein
LISLKKTSIAQRDLYKSQIELGAQSILFVIKVISLRFPLFSSFKKCQGSQSFDERCDRAVLTNIPKCAKGDMALFLFLCISIINQTEFLCWGQTLFFGLVEVCFSKLIPMAGCWGVESSGAWNKFIQIIQLHNLTQDLYLTSLSIMEGDISPSTYHIQSLYVFRYHMLSTCEM